MSIKECLKIKINFRWFVPPFLEELIHLEDICFEYDSWPESKLRRVLASEKVTCIVCVNDKEQAIGYCIARRFEKTLNLLRIAVHPNVRRQKIGKSLLQRLRSKLKKDRLCHIDAIMTDTDLVTQRFFAANNFRFVSSVLEYHVGGDGYLFRFTEAGKCSAKNAQ
jgi:ribosomal-protein-alanine N-acetyltransferase